MRLSRLLKTTSSGHALFASLLMLGCGVAAAGEPSGMLTLRRVYSNDTFVRPVGHRYGGYAYSTPQPRLHGTHYHTYRPPSYSYYGSRAYSRYYRPWYSYAPAHWTYRPQYHARGAYSYPGGSYWPHYQPYYLPLHWYGYVGVPICY